jgi:hypothetical protein
MRRKVWLGYVGWRAAKGAAQGGRDVQCCSLSVSTVSGLIVLTIEEKF